MFTTTKAVRFDDGDYGQGAYCGWNFDVIGGGTEFSVRTYDNEPSALIVIAPANARDLPTARECVGYLLSTIGGNSVSFYDSASGRYRRVDPISLDFV